MYLVYYKNTCLYLKENGPYILHISKKSCIFASDISNRIINLYNEKNELFRV